MMSLPLASSAPLPSSTAAQGIGKTAGEFLSQWRNPNDVLSILLIIGGSTVRTALAQLAGNSTFVPVCFSFGWVAFSFENIVSMAGEGRLMPNPDYPCKVINAESGYARENRSWMLGRLLRDNEEPLNEEALCISIWHAKRGNEGTRKAGHSDQRSWIFLMNAAMIVVQLAIAAIPWGIYGDWSVFVVTTAGTVLALSTGALPQWRAEKLSCRSNESKKDILITRGIGTRHVLLIIGNGASLDFEDIAGGDSPRSYRIWKNHRKLNAMADYTNSSTPSAEKSFSLAPRITGRSEPYKPGDLPLPFWFTRIMTVLFAGLWICLLISVAGLQLNAWFLLLVGAIGMVQNSFVAGFRQNLRASGLYFDTQETPIKKNKVMHALMQLETQYPNAGLCLLSECK